MEPGDEVPKEFWVGLVYATLVGFALKLTAVALEQELIGRQFGNYVAVRSFIRINSLEMRATRRILRRPGINTAKCAILVGGPDWPTSVTTGILKLNLLQMLLGTTPILPLIAASTAAGGMQLLKTKGDLYDSITVIVTFLSFLAQTASTLLAMYFIERTSTQYAAELAAEPPDEEVLAHDERQATPPPPLSPRPPREDASTTPPLSAGCLLKGAARRHQLVLRRRAAVAKGDDHRLGADARRRVLPLGGGHLL